MTPNEFCCWLSGYLAAAPESVPHEVVEKFRMVRPMPLSGINQGTPLEQHAAAWRNLQDMQHNRQLAETNSSYQGRQR